MRIKTKTLMDRMNGESPEAALSELENKYARKEFFHSEKRKFALAQEAMTWCGTPFFAHGKIKGAGVDCVQLAAQIYIATGFLDAFEPGAYTMDGGRHAGTSIVIDWTERSGKFSRVGGCASFAVGDLLCFRVAKSKLAWHVGVMVSEKTFVHVLSGRRVIFSSIDDLQGIRLTAIYRPMEVRA